MIHSNKKDKIGFLIFLNKLKKNTSRTDITNDDQKSYAFVPTYGDGSTDFHRQMISVVVFFYSNTPQNILVDYAVTEMVCFGDN